MRMNETGSGMIKAKERRGWSKRMAAHRALEKMQKEYKATRALVMMVERRIDLLLNILGLKYSPLGCVWGGPPTIRPDVICFIVVMMFLAHALNCGQEYHACVKCRTIIVGTSLEARRLRSRSRTRLPRNGLNSVSARLELRSRSNEHGDTLESACGGDVERRHRCIWTAPHCLAVKLRRCVSAAKRTNCTRWLQFANDGGEAMRRFGNLIGVVSG